MQVIRRAGFTLIELSIVLVIIGLITGGVLAGRELIRAAQLRAVVADFDQFNAAAQTFKTKYNCLPGDCPNATEFFGAYGSCGSYNSAPLTSSTCNGDGDFRIPNKTWDGSASVYTDESLLFWNHLSHARLLTGFYSGRQNSGGGFGLSVPGGNVPPSKLENGCYTLDYSGISDEQRGFTMPINNNYFAFGSAVTLGGVTASWCFNPLRTLSAADALSLDTKVDDGRATTGTIQPTQRLYGGSTNISASGGCLNAARTAYDAAVQGTACNLMVKTRF